MQRKLFDDSHLAFAESVAAFTAKEVVPHYDAWEAAGIVDREAWLAAGRAGLLGLSVPEEYGGGGNTDFRFNAVLIEAMAFYSGFAIGLHNDIIGPYLTSLGTEEQKRRWLPGFCSGELVTAIAMSEPGAGSDLQGMATTAVRRGDTYVLNGSKTFISNGILSDLVVVAAKTDPAAGATSSRGVRISLFVLERGMPGFERGRNLDKIGLHAQDTAELFFSDVEVPAANLLGEEGRGLHHLLANLPQERLVIALGGLARAERIFGETLEYCRNRKAFGRSIGQFQHNRFLLAELATELAVTRTFADRCIADLTAGELSVPDAAMVKWWCTEVANKVLDRCLQLHGGYGYMNEFNVARAWKDARIGTIYGGTTEIMKEIIGRDLGF
jgi:alkylation response protein AidB-like acyl-CoA dehydrogenase